MTNAGTAASFDVIVIGGGLVGLPLAIACAEAGISVALVEREPVSRMLAAPFDGRTTAVALGQKRMLAGLGIWAGLDALAQPILDIRVIERGAEPFVHYDHRTIGSDPLGWIVENRHFRQALDTAAAGMPGLTRLAPLALAGIETGPRGADVTLSDGRVLTARLVVGADGKDSAVRQAMAIDTIGRRYGQRSISCTIAHERPHYGVAIENFLPGGPFAILPMTGQRSSIVWTDQTDRVARYLALDAAAFVAALSERVGRWLGALELVGGRDAYPLSVFIARRLVGPRVALVGDAAHLIHPIAGQGLNLGLRDVAALAELVVDACRLGLDPGAPGLLARYEAWRRPDIAAMVAATDGLNTLFSNDLPGLRAARQLGLGLVNRLPPLKSVLMRHAMGVLGPVPRLIRGDAL